MSFYRDRILPHLVHRSMRSRRLVPYRERVISAAEGRVLEIGIGAGANLPFYPSRVQAIVGLEPAPRLLAMARRAASKSPAPITFLGGAAAAIPLEDGSVDTVLTTWTLCTIPEAVDALREMRRVLKPGGQLLFVEHGRAPDAGVRKWQDRLNPLWARISGGCQLNRPIRTLIEAAGFAVTEIEIGYLKGRNPMTFMYEGRAKPA